MDMPTLSQTLLALLLSLFNVASGVLFVRPYPALIHRFAPPGTPVLSVTAYSESTDKPLVTVSLTSSDDASFFEIVRQANLPKEWVLRVKKNVTKTVGYVFHFSVYALENGIAKDKSVKINVTEQNVFHPSFEQQEYSFLVYRNGFDYGLDHIGTVKATDGDSAPYNSVFRYHLLDPSAIRYFHVDQTTGDIEMIDNLPPNITNITFNVTAIDSGSPQLLNVTKVTISVTDLPPPDIFCVAVEKSVARICWKDPTNGSYVMKYELLFQMDGQNATTIPVNVNGIKDETCSIVRGNQLGRNYTFTVRVLNGLEWSPDSVQRKVRIERQGLYGDCPLFSNCSVWEPCRNHGECLVNDDLSYTCNCTKGWAGRNCTGVDLCTTSPCNNGKCNYAGDKQVKCDCPPTHYGNFCQYYNVCSTYPCTNNAECIAHINGTYTCICADNYVGEVCDTRDPCTPSLCVHGVCSALDPFNYTCSCPEGYFGEYCNEEDECILHKPCYRGNCTLNTNKTESDEGFICECPEGFRGDRCETFDVCIMQHQLCKNEATCVYKAVNSYTCICTQGFWGGECQHYDHCVSNPCMGGQCRNVSDEDYVCSCDGGHYGDHCEHYDNCYDKPCLTEDSVCVNVSDTDYHCECPGERFGKKCEKINGCKISFCHNNATCTNISDSGSVQCDCAKGYTGKFCNEYDPCVVSPCQNGGTCVYSDVSRDYSCACSIGFQGDLCQYEDPCAYDPCLNNGTCITDVESYYCTCDRYFYGTHCENVHFCQLDHGCLNGATCAVIEGQLTHEVTLTLGLNTSVRATIGNGYTCACRRGYIGERCENSVSCMKNICGEGQCVSRGEGHMCICPDGTERINCDDAFCEDDGPHYDKTGLYTWSKTAVGATARITCRHGPRIIFSQGAYQDATRECAVLYNGISYWKKPNTDACMQMQEGEVSESLRNLASMTRDASGLKPEEIANITSILEELFFFSFENLDIAREMTMVVGNLLDANETVLIESNTNTHSSERLVWLLNEFVSNIKSETNVTIETENINLQVINFTKPDTAYMYEPNMESNDKHTQSGVSLKLPAEALKSSEEEEFPRIEFMTFRSSSFFIPESNAPPQEVVLKQWVVTAVVHGRQVVNLTMPVEIVIENIEKGENHTCVFWDIEHRMWSNEGVETLHRGQNQTKCLSYHLTSFAILLDPSPDHPLSQDHEQILTVISYIGCGVSIVGLALTILSYSLFRCLNREKSGKILMNLCASMLLLNVVFILGSETSLSISGNAMCKAVAILLHYFLLSTLTWMLVEAINMYQALITVFTKYSGYFMLKRCIFAWGFPALVVIVTVSIDDDNYQTTTELCFLSHGNQLAFFISLLGPACLILMINIAVFIMVSRVILKPKFTGQVTNSDSLNPAQIRGAFTVMTLLGVTWVFGPFAINEAKLVVNYVFTVLNSLQGFLIFVFRCCFNPEVRLAWIVLVKTGKFKRRRGPLKGYTSDTTSSKGDSKINGSFADTMKSNVYNSVGKPRNILSNDRYMDPRMHQQRQQIASKASTDLNTYFDDCRKYGNGNGQHEIRRVSNSSETHNGYNRNGDLRNGDHGNRNGELRNGDHGEGITTIYTGKNNGVRRLSGFIPQKDEFTKL